MIKLGLCSMSFQKLGLDEVVEICRNHSLEALEWSGKPEHLPPGSPAEKIKEAARLCADAGIATPSYGSYFNVLRHSPEQFALVLDVTRGLGADTVRVWSGEWNDPGELEGLSQDQVKTLAEKTAKFAQMAAEREVRLAFEYHLNYPTCGADDTLRIIEKAGHENCYTYFQPLPEPKRNSGQNVADLEKVFPRLAYVHCHYYENDKLLPLARGAHVWKPLFNKLLELRYSGPLYLEYYSGYTPEKLRADLEFLHSLDNSTRQA